MKRLFLTSILAASALAAIQSAAYAQNTVTTDPVQTEEPEDEVIVEGIRGWEGHKGMDAFWSGDFETAEIEFEREFKSFKRAESSQYNAAVAADIGYDRAADTGVASIGGQGSGGPGGGPPPQVSGGNPDLGVSGRFNNRRSSGRNLLNDGKLTDEDFAFTKYMAGLSELQQEKYDEAKASFKTSLFYNGKNHDARMRLGLLYVVKRDFDKAADQLEALDKLRKDCKRRNCEEYSEILVAAQTLASGITNAIDG